MRQTRLTSPKPLQDKKCPVCGEELGDCPVAIPGEKANYCSEQCVVISKI